MCIICRISKPASFIPWIAVARRQCAVRFAAFFEMSDMKQVNWYFFFTGTSLNYIEFSSGDDKADVEQWLKKCVAFGFVLDKNSFIDFTEYFSLNSGIAYIRFSFGLSFVSILPYHFFLFCVVGQCYIFLAVFVRFENWKNLFLIDREIPGP